MRRASLRPERPATGSRRTATPRATGRRAKSFVQNHPYDSTKLLYYAAIEGDEVPTYTRGHARLSESFEWVTNPDIGLTAHVTPRGAGASLYVERVTTRELVVRAADGTNPEAEFDYLVQGLRVGFENLPGVRVEDRDTDTAYLPSFGSIESMLERHPEPGLSTALARFLDVASASGRGDRVDMSRTRDFVAAIGTFDPALHRFPAPESGGTQSAARERPARDESLVRGTRPSSGSAVGSVATQRVPGAVSSVRVFAPAMPGDVLVADPLRPCAMRPSSRAADPAVIGVATGRPGRWDDSVFRSIDELDPELAYPLNQALENVDREGALVVWSELERRHAPLVVSFTSNGIVRCKADSGNTPIAVGDLLTTGSATGHATRTGAAVPGSVLGKALEPLAEGSGEIAMSLEMTAARRPD